MPCAVSLHLHIKVVPQNRSLLMDFLRKARPFYEQPGGIRMRLLEDQADPNSLIEVFEYETPADYEADERRVSDDPAMKSLLETWRSLLDGPPVVRVYRDRSGDVGCQTA